MQQKVVDTALGIQGNGWVLILQDFQIVPIQNHVLRSDIILAIDIWEHATVDYDYDREKFFENYWNIVNWKKVESLRE
jgi:Fe-Mn family superoxide dismutase